MNSKAFLFLSFFTYKYQKSSNTHIKNKKTAFSGSFLRIGSKEP
ncbi:hypothetical protein HMPREF9073_03219 [Capnocytophaga sp. oral taxon 326 str. F0382]|nr:hypothetical protein HMPREF9073_03219 [Capnocytophaga sp. oral taxon 326 str. F0382]